MYDKVFKGGFVRGNVNSASGKCWVWGSRVLLAGNVRLDVVGEAGCKNTECRGVSLRTEGDQRREQG